MTARARDLTAVALLVAVVGATFAPVLRNDFVNWDDVELIVRNPDFRPDALGHRPSRWYVWSAYPVTYLLWWGLAHVAYDDTDADAGPVMRPTAYHGTSVALHAAAVLLVYAILLRLTDGSRMGALAGAGLFAVHPAQVETVAWICAMPTLVCTMTALWAIWQYVLAAAPRRDAAPADAAPRRALLMASATAGYGAALLAKPAGVVVPLVVLVLELGVLRRPARRWATWLAAWVLLAVPAARFTTATIPGAATAPPPPLWLRPLVALDALGFYLGKLALPVGLCADYGRSPASILSHPRELAATGMGAAAGVALVAWLGRRDRLAATGALVALAALLPVLGLVPFQFQQFSTTADRYLYLPMLGVGMIVASLVRRGAGAGRRSGAWVAAGTVILSALALLSRAQVGVWRDTHALFGHTLEVNPASALAHGVLGYTYRQEGRADEAAAHLRRAVELNPSDAAARFNLGNALVDAGDFERAVAQYRQAAAMRPDDARVRLNLGAALVAHGRYDEAVAAFTEARALDPDSEAAARGLAAAQRLRDAAPPPTSPAAP